MMGRINPKKLGGKKGKPCYNCGLVEPVIPKELLEPKPFNCRLCKEVVQPDKVKAHKESEKHLNRYRLAKGLPSLEDGIVKEIVDKNKLD